VELHEHGHRDIAEAAANDLARTLEALPGHPSCDALAAAARNAASTLLARHAQTQIAYDRETGHGATQGAVLSIDLRP
jgi:predicted secreted Zn-dependent protease